MKKSLLVLLGLSLIFLAGSCRWRGNYISYSEDNQKVEIRYSGTIKFNETETGIESISPRGFLRFKKDDRELIAESNNHGEIHYQFYMDGDKVSLDATDQAKFIAAVIRDLIQIGFDAEARFDRIYKKGGASAILAEVDSLKGDFVKSMYLEMLLKTGGIRQDELTAIANKISADLGSDFEKAKLLSKFPDIKDSSTTVAYIRAARSIGSDFEKANALRNILNQSLSPNQNVLTLDAIKSIGSDFEKSQLLSHSPGNYFADSATSMAYLGVVTSIGSDFEKANALRNMLHQSLGASQVDQFLVVTGNIGSDFEKANLLKELIDQERVKPENFDRMLEVTASLGSDFEKSNIVKELIDKNDFKGETFNRLLSVIGHMGSEFEKTNALKKLAEKNLETEAQWAGLINSIADLQSSFEKANILVQIANKIPKSDIVRTAYMKAAKTIPEDNEYGRVVKAVE